MKKFLLFLIIPISVMANENLPVNFSAKEIIYDHNKGIATAIGGVKANQGTSTLSAPLFQYNTVNKEFYAEQGVKIKKDTGEFLNLDSVVFDENINSMRVNEILLDYKVASLSAKTSRKTNENIVLEEISYTACDRSCSILPWEIKANTMIRSKSNLNFYGAYIKLYGVPVFYTPYFSSPNPEKKRVGGFLVPSIGSSKDLGVTLSLPYYIPFSQYSDFTFNPIYTSEEGVLWSGEFNQNLKYVNSKTKGAYIGTDRTYENRGYVFSKNNIYFDNIWRGILDVNYASDDTFLRKYNITNDAYLKSTAKIEGLSNRSYFSILSYHFQDMRNPDYLPIKDRTVPLVLPSVTYLRKFEPLKNGTYFTFQGDTASLFFKDASASSHRASGDLGVVIPYITKNGLVLEGEAHLRSDIYYLDNIENDLGFVKSATHTRTTPIASIKAHMPFYRSSENFYQVIDPTIQFVSSPNNKNGSLPNWDSTTLVFDDTNLFSLNRFQGYDRIESGNRLNYGLSWDFFGKSFGKITTFLGQSYNFSEELDEDYSDALGMYNQRSDYIGSIFFYPTDWIRFNYKFRANNQDLNFARNEFNIIAGNDKINLRTDYIYDQEQNNPLAKREEVYGRIYYQMFDKVSIYMYDRYDIAVSEQREIGGGLIYEINCFKIDFGARKEYVSDRDFKGGDSIFLNISLKTLGSFGMGDSWDKIEKRNTW